MKGLGRKFIQNQNKLYAWIYLSLPTLRSSLEEIIKPSSRILDLGCGNGAMIPEMIKLGAQESNIQGIDIDPEFIKEAENTYPKVKFTTADIRKWKPLHTNAFDLCIAIHVLHYFSPKDLAAIFASVSRALKPSGHFLFLVTHPIRWVKDNLQQYFSHKYKIIPTTWGTKLRIHLNTIEDYAKTLADTGFVIEQILEPTPVKAGKNDRDNYKKYKEGPNRLILIARKK